MLRVVLLLLILYSSLQAITPRYSVTQHASVSVDGKEYFDVNKVTTKEQMQALKTALYYRIKYDTNILKTNVFHIIIPVPYEQIVDISHPISHHTDSVSIQLDANSSDTLTFQLKSTEADTSLTLKLLTPFEFHYIFPYEAYLYAFTYGILFFTFLSSMIFFLYNRQASFFYHALMQLGTIALLSLMVLSSTYSHWLYSLMLLLNIIIIQFTIHFLHTKRILNRVHKALQFVLYLNLLVLLLWVLGLDFFLLTTLAMLLAYPLFMLAAWLTLRRGHKIAIFYLLGWASLLLLPLLSLFGIPDLFIIYYFHLIYPLEVIFFTLGLAYQVKEQEHAKLQQERLLVQQSKMASMGEMIANIAHQWRQPLTSISYAFMSIKAAFNTQKLTETFLAKKSTQIEEQLAFMSQTIDDFRNFFQPDKAKQHFSINQKVTESLSLLQAALDQKRISVSIDAPKEVHTYNYATEFSQVIFNLLNNAKQALESTENGQITITIIEESKSVSVSIEDNGGGVDSTHIHKIFDPYFTTKQEGSGIGLYMSKEIIRHMGGTLAVSNTSEGALFSVTLPIKA